VGQEGVKFVQLFVFDVILVKFWFNLLKLKNNFNASPKTMCNLYHVFFCEEMIYVLQQQELVMGECAKLAQQVEM